MQEIITRITATTNALQEAKQLGVHQLRQHAVPANADESIRRLFEKIGDIVAGESFGTPWDKSRVWGIDYAVHSTSTIEAFGQIGSEDDEHLEDDVLAYSRTVSSLSVEIQIIREAFDVSKIVQESDGTASSSETFASGTWHGLPVPGVLESKPQATVLFVGAVLPEIRITRDAYDDSRIVQESGESVSDSSTFATVTWYGLPVPNVPEDIPKATVWFAASVLPDIHITRDAYDESKIVQESGESIGYSIVSSFAAWYALPTPDVPEDIPQAIVQSAGSIIAGVILVAESFDASQIARLEHQIENRGHITAEIAFTENPLTDT
jgi:hypothetical protein